LGNLQLQTDSPELPHASQELRAFLQSIRQPYVGYAEQLHRASFESITELAAATPEQLVQYRTQYGTPAAHRPSRSHHQQPVSQQPQLTKAQTVWCCIAH
jgi:hypothetical protein